jgi:HEAT repeat protein
MRLMPFVSAALAAAFCLPAGCTAQKKEPSASPPKVSTPDASGDRVVAIPADAANGVAENDVAALRRQLADATDVAAQVQAIDALASVGKRGAAAADDLIALTAASDADVRWHAARALGMLGSAASSASPTLVKLLGDAEPVVAAQAAHALGLVNKSAGDSVVDPLIEATLHADPRVRRAAVKSLRRVSTPERLAPLVARHLSDADPSVVLPALHTLADMRDESVPLLLAALDEPKARYWAAVAAAEIGPDAAPAVGKLTTLAADGELDERMQAMFALAAIGEPAAAAAPTLIEALSGNEEMLQFAAAFALGKLRAAAADDSLTATAGGDDPFLAAVASWALARIHPDDPARVTAAAEKLRAGLQHTDATVKAGSINGLSDLAGSLDTETRQALATAYATLLDDPDPAVAVAAGGALVRLGPDAATAIRGELADMATRMRGMELLAAQGTAAKPFVAEMTAALADEDAAFASEAAVALAAVGADAAPAVPTLVKLLAVATPAPVRYTAMYALGRIGGPAKPALARLLELSQSNDELESTVAIWAALKIEPGDKELFETAIPRLQKALRAESELARLEAAVSLGDIGPAAAASIPMLELLLEDDPSRSVREAAAAALEKVAAGR